MRERQSSLALPVVTLFLTLSAFLFHGCGPYHRGPRPGLRSVDQITSSSPETICRQSYEVVKNNPYSQQMFESVFAQMVEQLKSSKSAENADLIWKSFVVPLRESGKVPADLARTTWNCYFSRQFVSLPSVTPVRYCCLRLAEIKKNLEKEYLMKKAGFEVSLQGSPEYHFLNAMYVYNTLWAACDSTE